MRYPTVCSWCGQLTVAAGDEIQTDIEALGPRLICVACCGKMLDAVDAAIGASAAYDDGRGVSWSAEAKPPAEGLVGNKKRDGR